MSKPCRILVVDDREEITETFKELLSPEKDIGINELKGLASSLFDTEVPDVPAKPKLNLRVDTANQGLEAVEMARVAKEEDDPIRIALLDFRMPPGINGLETALKLIEIDEKIEIAFVSAYSDISFEELSEHLGNGRFLLLKKPVVPEEINAAVAYLTRTRNKCE